MIEKNKFAISNKSLGKVDCLYLNGFLDAHTAPELETALSKLIDEGHNKIIVNFSELDYISSAGLGVFMAFIEDVRNKDGDIKLCSMKPRVFSVFDLLGFPLLFDILDNEQTAIERFSDNDVKPSIKM